MPADEKVSAVSFKIQQDLLDWLRKEAKRNRSSISFVIRDLINDAKLRQKAKEKQL